MRNCADFKSKRTAKFLTDRNKRNKTESQQEELKPGENAQNDDRNIFNPRFIAEVYQEFYRELAKAYAGLMNGFKKYK